MADVKQIELNGVILDVKDATARADLATLSGVVATKVPDTRKVNNKALSADITVNAADVPYNNASSGLSATTGQGAIDELAGRTAHIEESTENGSLSVGHFYYLSFKDTANSRRMPAFYRASTSAVRLTLSDVTSGGALDIYTVALQYGSNTITINSVYKTTISNSGVSSAPADYTANLQLEYITRVL